MHDSTFVNLQTGKSAKQPPSFSRASILLLRPLQRIRLRLKFCRCSLTVLMIALIGLGSYYIVLSSLFSGFNDSNSATVLGDNASFIQRWLRKWPKAVQLRQASSIVAADANALTAVREMAQFAWSGYVESCLRKFKGGNELAPVSGGCTSYSDILVGPGNFLTVLDSLDTLWLLNLRAEFEQARAFVCSSFNPRNSTSGEVNVFETTIRLLGGLLGAFAVTQDSMFGRMAAQLGDGLGAAFLDGKFQTSIRLFSNLSSQRELHPAELGTLYLEFAYLSELTADEKYYNWVERNQRALLEIEGLDGVLQVRLESKKPNQLQQALGPYSAGAFTDSYYEYLVKRCIFDLKPQRDCVKQFTKALDGIMKHLSIRVGNRDNKEYTCITHLDLPGGSKRCVMEHLTCFAGGMYALAYLQVPSRTDWLRFAENITEACYMSYEHSPSKLGPEKFSFDSKTNRFVAEENYYILRPETVESIFYLYRVTGNPKYRQWGWNIVEALNKSARIGSGFSGIQDLSAVKLQHDNKQWSFFLAETLKYLYLLFSPSDYLPLDQWMFTTEAHVIPTRINRARRTRIRTNGPK